MLIFLNGMFHFARHERIRVLFENAQAGASAEIKALSMIDGAGLVFGVFDDTSTDFFIFRQLRCCCDRLNQDTFLQIRCNR